MWPVSETLFCCGTGYSSNLTCDTPNSETNYDAFDVRTGIVINNRTSGSTGPNDTTCANTTATTTVVAKPSGSPSGSSSSAKTAIGAGVGVPLGVALLGALAIIWRQRGHEQRLKKKVEAWEGKYEALARKAMENRQPAEIAEIVQMQENARLLELDNSQARGIFEMGGVKGDR